MAGLNEGVSPAPYGPTPTSRQLFWHRERTVYGFLHFTVNTFTGREWGFGDESPEIFNPTDFDGDQIAAAFAAGGMETLILTCKHHDGFCLWPSPLTQHSVAASPWRDGQGDMVREISDACRRHGLRFGVYLSPWDRNHADYARPEYLLYYRAQLRDLLTQYGPISEVWFDGANGGDGWYGGANETRRIDPATYYDWPATWAIVRELQPEAVIFSDVGPDIRWVGNEEGVAGDPCWATLDVDAIAPGQAEAGYLNRGDRDTPNRVWLPPECDTSIRPGWFHHAEENDKVKSGARLVDLYFQSVGRGGSFMLNLPPDRRGRVGDEDVASVTEMRRLLTALFARPLSGPGCDVRVTASRTRGGKAIFSPERVLDGDPNTYWATDDGVTAAEIVLRLPAPLPISVMRLREHLPLGQRVHGFAVDLGLGEGEDNWQEIFAGESLGACRLIRLNQDQNQDQHQDQRAVVSDRVRLRILKAAACPAIEEIALFGRSCHELPLAPQATSDRGHSDKEGTCCDHA